MAKVKHNNFLDSVQAVFTEARNQRALHLYAEDTALDGMHVCVHGKSMIHFGTTGYLGLEHDMRLKEAAIAAIHQYGTQFPLSKSYIAHPLYRELEDLVGAMYGCPIVITKNSTLGHMGAIPALVSDQDGIILDHQVHWSVQTAAKQLKSRSVPIEMIRHNRLDLLEAKVQQMASKVERIWFMADGVYSMFGDVVPIQELMALVQKYRCLHLYIDDVHGMSWKGPHGTGYVMEQLGTIPDKVVLVGTLGKTFGAGGAVIACQKEAWQQKIKTFGGPLTFSVQLDPATVGAAIASAKIHLSPEITRLQEELAANIQYLTQLLAQTVLPLVATDGTPIFYIAVGMPITGYELIKRLQADGCYINIGIFPGVPIKQTGLRITVTRLHTKEQLELLVGALVHHYPLALQATGTTANEVRRLFQLPLLQEAKPGIPASNSLNVQVVDTIEAVSPALWNRTMGTRNVFDWQGMLFLEQLFQGQDLPEHNWEFRYVVITDTDDLPVLVTFLSKALWKDDLLATADVSAGLEMLRKEDPYVMTAEVIGMGCPFTEGLHYYEHQGHAQKWEAWQRFLKIAGDWCTETECSRLLLRDFPKETTEVSWFVQQGFVPVAMPETAVVRVAPKEPMEVFVQQLSKRSRKHFRTDIAPFEAHYEVNVVPYLEGAEMDIASELLEAVRVRNLGLNTFGFPSNMLAAMGKHPQWEFITLALRPEYHEGTHPKLVGVMCCYTNQGHTYTPAYVGMDYRVATAHQLYRQLLYQTIVRAHALGLVQVDFGLTAAFEKKKLGARIISQLALVQVQDNYRTDWLELLQNGKFV